MMCNIVYKKITISELSDWLLHSKDNGISDYMITRARAWALINNPSAEEDNIVLAAVCDANRAIGYTALFPDKLQKPILEGVYYWGLRNG